MNNHILENKGKQLSWLLRHDSNSFEKGLIDKNGWRSVDEICKNYHYTLELFDEIVDTNNKKRYEYNEDKTKIRARQGHSIDVDVELKEDTTISESNPYLYHGTSDRFIESIKNEGLTPQTRQYVHLSVDVPTATNVGKRHGGKTYIIVINAYRMKCDGEKIYISNNGVYCVKKVEPKYFTDIMNKSI
mgnify:CR=1 FL=1